MHTSSFNKMTGFKQRHLSRFQGVPLKILDLGSQDINGCYRPIFDDPSWTYTGIDLAPGKNVDIVLADPYDWSGIRSESVDVVVSGQAFEHIEFFWLTMLEISRVLKPQGLCCIAAPSGGYEHRFPVDCWRFYSDGMRALASFARLDVLEATTEWTPDDYPDGSQVWKDSVLIASKPKMKTLEKIRRGILTMALRHLAGAMPKA